MWLSSGLRATNARVSRIRIGGVQFEGLSELVLRLDCLRSSMAQDTTNDSRPEVNFDALRNAITPVNLMFDGRLWKDIKSLIGHITQAIKKVNREQPDYQGALIEINLLEAAFNSAVVQWEQKLSGEIQRLRNSVETSQKKSLGATKKISKFQEELTRGRASTQSMPIRIGQVKNELIRASGHTSAATGTGSSSSARSRLAEKGEELPVIYQNASSQILRKASQRSTANFKELALKILENVSKPVAELTSEEKIFGGRLYYVHSSIAREDQEELVRTKAQFVIFDGLNERQDAYRAHSVFPDLEATFEITFDDFEQLRVSKFQPLDAMELIVQLLKAKFKEADFKETFRLYAAIRQKALENQREEKFNPKQQVIHAYLTDRIFEFVGISFDNRGSEVRFVEQIDNAIHLR